MRKAAFPYDFLVVRVKAIPMFQSFFSRQLAKPSGLFGRLFTARWLEKTNVGMNALTLDSLALGENDRLLEVGFGSGYLLHPDDRAVVEALHRIAAEHEKGEHDAERVTVVGMRSYASPERRGERAFDRLEKNGLSHACGVKTDGTIACWGLVDSSLVPAGTFSSVNVGRDGSVCAVRSDGTLACWYYMHGM